MKQVAAFDFDGTITTRDTLLPFLARVAGSRSAMWAMAKQARYARRYRDPAFRDGVKERVLGSLLTGHPAADLVAQGERYATELPKLYRPEALERIGWHRTQGHTLVLVSASLDVYARPAAETLGFAHTIAVELATGADGACTGAMVHPNVRAEQKAIRLRAWLGTEPTELWAYGNSSGDTELLAMADHPTWIKELLG